MERADVNVNTKFLICSCCASRFSIVVDDNNDNEQCDSVAEINIGGGNEASVTNLELRKDDTFQLEESGAQMPLSDGQSVHEGQKESVSPSLKSFKLPVFSKQKLPEILTMLFEYPSVMRKETTLFNNGDSCEDLSFCKKCETAVFNLYSMFREFMELLKSDGKLFQILLRVGSNTEPLMPILVYDDNDGQSESGCDYSRSFGNLRRKGLLRRLTRNGTVQKILRSNKRMKARQKKLCASKKAKGRSEVIVSDGCNSGKSEGSGSDNNQESDVDFDPDLADGDSDDPPYSPGFKNPGERKPELKRSGRKSQRDNRTNTLAERTTSDLGRPSATSKQFVKEHPQHPHNDSNDPSVSSGKAKNSKRKSELKKRGRKPQPGNRKAKLPEDECTSSDSKSTSVTKKKRIRNELRKEFWFDKAKNDPNRTCDICGKPFLHAKTMQLHKTTVHEGKKPFECEHCGKGFTQKIILKEHTCDYRLAGGEGEFLRIAREEQLFKWVCEVCGKRFKKRSSFVVHQKNHAGETYPCDKCDKKFRRPDHLKSHAKLVHSDEKRFVCTICDLRFKALSGLRQHNDRKHSNPDQKYLCNTCGKSMKTLAQMVRHEKTHEDVLPFECQVCGKRFKMKDYLGQHLRKGKSCKTRVNRELTPVFDEPQDNPIINFPTPDLL